MKRTRLNQYSEKRLQRMNREADIRIALCKRAGGQPISQKKTVRRNGKAYDYLAITCVGGTCECGMRDCPKHPPAGQPLEPHEIRHRSLGGKLSLANSIMVTRQCHKILQKNEPKWSKSKED